jgi:hypothetical protein
MGEGGIPLGMGDSVSTRKTWAVSGLLSSGRVGSTDGEIRSTTWVSFSKGRMGSTGGIDRLGFTLLWGEWGWRMGSDQPLGLLVHPKM